jgi:hypothetical protein
MNRSKEMKSQRRYLAMAVVVILSFLAVSCDQQGQPGEHWTFTIQGDKITGNLTWDMDGVTIVFEGVDLAVNGGGSLQVGGDVGEVMRTHAGSEEIGFSHQYVDEINFLRFREHKFMLLHGGQILYFEGRSIDLKPGKKRVTVRTDGSLKIEEI